MILNDILKLATVFNDNSNDDVVDKLYYKYSVVGMSVYLLFLTIKQYVGDPIQCIVNSGTSGEIVKYIHSMCWLNGTNYINESSGTIIDFNNPRKLNYYQWIVFILIFLVFLFKVPPIIWNFFITLNGFDFSYVTQTIMKKIYLDEYVESSNWLKTRTTIDSINNHLTMSFLKQKCNKNKSLLFRRKNKIGKNPTPKEISQTDRAKLRVDYPNLKTRPSFPLYYPYLLVKLMFLSVACFNFYFLTRILGFDYVKFGYEFTSLVVAGKYEFTNHYFPKRAVCYTKIPSKEEENTASVLCALPMNLTNEYFFAAYWFWLVSLIIMTVLSIVYWLGLLIRPLRRRMVLNALKIGPNHNINVSYTAAFYFGEEPSLEAANNFLSDKTGMNLMQNFELFFDHVCSVDVIFAIKIISINTNSLAFSDVLNNLWDNYLDLDELRMKDVPYRPFKPIKRPDLKDRTPLNEQLMVENEEQANLNQ